MEKQNLKPIVEALLFASEVPLNAGDLLKIIRRVDSEKETSETEVLADEDTPPSEESQTVELSPEEQLAQVQKEKEEALVRSDVQQVINELVNEYEQNAQRGFVLVNVAQGFQFRTRIEWAPYLRAMVKVAPLRLSQPSLETLSIVAYRQPITRAEIDQIRGVDSGGVLKTLLERNLVKIVGKKEEPGRPVIYGTTETFLEVFSLRSLQDLPTLKDLAQIETEMREKTSPGASVSLEESNADEDLLSEIALVRSYEDLEKEEQEAFEELDAEMKGLKESEEKALQALVQKQESVLEDSDSNTEGSESHQ